jgi:hypothetical protein
MITTGARDIESSKNKHSRTIMAMVATALMWVLLAGGCQTGSSITSFMCFDVGSINMYMMRAARFAIHYYVDAGGDGFNVGAGGGWVPDGQQHYKFYVFPWDHL